MSVVDALLAEDDLSAERPSSDTRFLRLAVEKATFDVWILASDDPGQLVVRAYFDNMPKEKAPGDRRAVLDLEQHRLHRSTCA
jgi:hypothetical protein